MVLIIEWLNIYDFRVGWSKLNLGNSSMVRNRLFSASKRNSVILPTAEGLADSASIQG
jgi:hypothetical protein